MEEQQEKYNLPEGWTRIALVEITIPAERVNANYFERTDTLDYIDIASINSRTNRIESPQRFIWNNAPSRAQQILKTGDILFSTVRPYLRNIAMVPKEFDGYIASSGFCIIRPINVNPVYIFNQILSQSFIDTVNSLAKGTSYPAVTNKIVLDQAITLPPLNEQNRIAVKLEEFFSELDHSIKNLELAREQLKVYRQVILQQAFEGKLTEQWRKENALEPAKKLLDKIKKERQVLFEQNLKEWKAAVEKWEKKKIKEKRPRKPRVPTQVSSLTSDELARLPTIPKSWIWDKLGAVCLKIMDGTHFSPKNSENGDYMYITAKNIQEGRIDLEGITYVTEEDHRTIYSRCDVQKGDILYIKDGATTGRTAVNDIDEEFSLLSSVGVFRTPKNLLIPKFLEYYLNSEVTRKRMLSKTAGVAITRLTLVKLNNSVVCLCSTYEQEKIVEILESQFSIIDNLEETINSSFQKAKSLRQSILKKAFKGELVEQNTNDESVIELLKRIQSEKKEYLEKEKLQKKNSPKKMKKLKTSLLDVIQNNFNNKDFTYDDLKKQCDLSYDDIKSQLFDLLEKGDHLKSIFDTSKEEIKYTHTS